jgi:hypothetical protein
MSKKTIIFNRYLKKSLHNDKPLGIQEVEVPKISRQLAYESGNVVIPMHWPPLPLGRYPGINFCLRLKQIQCHSVARMIMSVKKHPMLHATNMFYKQ